LAWITVGGSGIMIPMGLTAEQSVGNAHAWFEVNSGWAPPDEDTLADWLADGICRAPDDCLVTPDGWCEHGLASWRLILASIDRHPANRRDRGQRDSGR
jgi:hypothetical protein